MTEWSAGRWSSHVFSRSGVTDLTAMHRAIEGCARVYFGMSVSADYLTATVNTAAVARHLASRPS
jgi:hypothetical protein